MTTSRRAATWRTVAVITGASLVLTGAACANDDGDDNSRSAEWESPPSDWDAPSGESKAGCDITALPGDHRDEPQSEVHAVSASGEYIVGEMIGEEIADAQPVLWRDGKYHLIDGGDKHLEVKDVNSDGVVVGELHDEETWPELRPFVYYEGELTELEAVYDSNDAAMSTHDFTVAGINDDGDIIGNVTTTDDSPDEEHINVAGYHWDANDPDAGKTEWDGVVAAMNSTGDFIGITDDGVWKWDSSGEGEELSALADERTNLSIVDNEFSDLAGDWLLHAHEFKADISQDSEPGELGLETDKAIDTNGDSYGVNSGQAAVERDGEVTELPELSDGDESEVADVSEDGTVAAGTASDDTGRHAVVWNCD